MCIFDQYKTDTMKFLAYLIISLSLLSSCKMERRLYQSGLHIEWKNKNHRNLNEAKNESNLDYTRSKVKLSEQENNFSNPMVPKLEKTNLNEINESKQSITEDCDEIILRSGVIIKGKVLEIGVEEIKYKKCENLNGPSISIRKKDVFLVKYPNGTTDIMPEEKEVEKEEILISSYTNSDPVVKEEDKMTDSLGIFAIILGVLGIILTLAISTIIGALVGLVALIIGISSYSRIIKNGNKIKGKGLALTGIILGSISLLLALVLVVILLI